MTSGSSILRLGLALAAAVTLVSPVRTAPEDSEVAQEVVSLEKEAEAGRTTSQYYLALRYLHGVGTPRDEAKAVTWFERAAAGGDAGAAFNLARLLKEGRYVVADPARAVRLFRMAVREKVPGANVELGEMLLTGSGTGRDYGEAATLFHDAANTGNPTAAFNLGVMYARGLGVARDPSQALQWYQRAADEGEPNAQFNVANSILSKPATPADVQRAIGLLTDAAAQGVAAAMFTLGRIYEEGTVVPANEVDAIKWYRAAVASGHAGAMSNLARLLIQRQLGPGSDAEAVKLLEKAAEKLDPSALFNLGVLRERGIIVKRDPAAAKKSYRLAAELGFGPAQLALGIMMASSKSTDEQAEAVAWGILAHEQKAKLAGEEILDRLPAEVIADGQFRAAALRKEIEHSRALREDGGDVATFVLERVKPARASVNGFLISPGGVVVAPYSPIASASDIKVRYQGALQPATIIGVDEKRDVAVLSMNRKVDHWLGRSQLDPNDRDTLRGIWFQKPWEVELEAPKADLMHPVVAATPFGPDREWLAVDAVWDSAAVGGVLLDDKGVVGMLSGKRTEGATVPGVPNQTPTEYGVALRSVFIDGVVTRAKSSWPPETGAPLRSEDVAPSLVVVLGF